MSDDDQLDMQLAKQERAISRDAFMCGVLTKHLTRRVSRQHIITTLSRAAK